MVLLMLVSGVWDYYKEKLKEKIKTDEEQLNELLLKKLKEKAKK